MVSTVSVSMAASAAIQAAGGLVAYLRETQKADLAHVRAVTYKRTADCCSSIRSRSSTSRCSPAAKAVCRDRY
jgi:DNA mismatch repair ATPase MutS